MRGRQPERYCRLGHDKYQPHGTYILKGGRLNRFYNRCAVCERRRQLAKYYQRKAIR